MRNIVQSFYRKILPAVVIFFLAKPAAAQALDHWETVVFAGDEWRYFIGTSEPEANWRDLDFDAEHWESGPGGIGYGDGDDRTVIDPCLSLFMRRTFEIVDADAIEKAVFNMDYDDGFVAWLNGVEIARSNVGRVGDRPSHDEAARASHEARMYQGGAPSEYILKKDKLALLLKSGSNVLAVQVHNRSQNSSDMSAIPFLSIGLNEEARHYRPTPEWFSAPLVFQSSNLPILVIDSKGLEIPDEPRISARLMVKNSLDGQRNTLVDASELDCQISIEIRGSSSSLFDKKSYNIETQEENGDNLNVPLLGLPKENDWILYGPYSDKSLLRNAVAFYLARSMRRYASRFKFCELVLNGEYQGLYMLMEKLKRDKNRVDIAKLKVDENDGENVSGGYIIKVDKLEGEYDGWTSYSNPPRSSWKPIFFQYVYPKQDTITAAQKSYIRNYILDFEKALNKSSFRDPQSGYLPYIGLDSFVDLFIINEFTKDIDSYRFSTFIVKDKNGPLTMGPIWDYNLGFGNVDYGTERAMETDGWMYNKGGARMYWFPRMMSDRTFKMHLRDRWFALRQGPFRSQRIHGLVDSLAAHIDEAQARNFQRWPVLGKYLWPNHFVGDTWKQETDFLLNWMDERLVWMDENMPYTETRVAQRKKSSMTISLHPNPFNNALSIHLIGAMMQPLKIDVYDLNGRRVRTLFDGSVTGDVSAFQWDGRDENGDPLASGVYVVLLQMNGKRIFRKATLIK